MKKYEIELDEATSDYFEITAMIVRRPVEEIIAGALFKQVEIINREVFRDVETENDDLH